MYINNYITLILFLKLGNIPSTTSINFLTNFHIYKPPNIIINVTINAYKGSPITYLTVPWNKNIGLFVSNCILLILSISSCKYDTVVLKTLITSCQIPVAPSIIFFAPSQGFEKILPYYHS
jgi:hypothetical protein